MTIYQELAQITFETWLKGAGIVLGMIMFSAAFGVLVGKFIGKYDDDYTK